MPLLATLWFVGGIMVSHIRLGALVLMGALLSSASSGVARPTTVQAADWACPPSAAGVPLKEQMTSNDGSVGDYVFHCRYTKETKKRYIGSIYVNLQWIDAGSKAEGWIDLDDWCSSSPAYGELKTYPYLGQKLIRADWGATAAAGEGKWDKKGRRAVKELAATVKDRAGSCGAEYSPETTRTTSIVLSGGPDEEPPPLGATVPLPVDDQHRIVIGGLDGEVIREEFLGDQATIIGYGPMATDAEGNWSVSVDVDASVAPEAEADADAEPKAAVDTDVEVEAEAEADADAEPKAAADADVEVDADAEPKAAADADVEPEADADAELKAEAEADADAEPDSSPTPIPPPEMIGMPDAVAEYVAGLPPEAAGALRDITDHIAVLGDELVQRGESAITIPASDLASLRLLAPGLVKEIKLVSGGMIVDSYIDVRVTPVIGQDGLIEFRTSRLQEKVRAHEVVRALVLALNNFVDESGGRFSTISVTPEGLTVTAERRAEDDGS